MQDINKKLTDIRIKIEEKNRLNSILSKLNDEKKEAVSKKNKLLKQLNKERKDVEKLENLSLSNFIQTIIGKKDEKLEKEKSEFLSAKLKYDTADAEVKRLDKEIERVNARISEIGDLNNEYQSLIKEKEKILINSSREIKEKLDNINEREVSLEKLNMEIREAITAGEEVLRSLDRVYDALKSAKNWGTFDMLGGGMLSGLVKHGKIDKAQSEINKTQYLIKRFHRELNDIGGEVNLSIEVSSFLKFADFFFDNFFTDMFVQSKIHESQLSVSRAIEKVKYVINELKRRYSNNNTEIEKLRKEREEITLNF